MIVKKSKPISKESLNYLLKKYARKAYAKFRKEKGRDEQVLIRKMIGLNYTGTAEMTTGYADSGDGKLYYETRERASSVLIHAGFVDSGVGRAVGVFYPKLQGSALICAGWKIRS